MDTSWNRFRGHDTGDLQVPGSHPHRGPPPLGFYLDIPSTGDSRPHIDVLDFAFENELGSLAGHTSPSVSPTEHRSANRFTPTPNLNVTEDKTKKSTRFKFSLTAPPPKSKPKSKQPGPAVRAGGRGGAGNIRRLKSASALPPAETSNKRAAPVPVDIFPVHPNFSDGETSNPERGSWEATPVTRQATGSRMKTGRGNQAFEGGMSERVLAHEDARRRGGVININDDADSASPLSGSSGPRDFMGGRVRGAVIIRNRSPETNSASSGGSGDVQASASAIPEMTNLVAAHPSARPLLPGPGPGGGGPVLTQEDTDVLVARGYDAHLGRTGSGSGSGSGTRRPSARAVPRPRLLIPQDPPPRRGRPANGADHNEPDSDAHFYFPGPPAAHHPSQRAPRAPPAPSLYPRFDRKAHQFGVMETPEERGAYAHVRAHYSFQTTLTSPTIVSPPTPSTVFEEGGMAGGMGTGMGMGIKGARLHVANGTHPEPEGQHAGVGADEEAPAAHGKSSRDEGRATPYLLDLFEGRGTASSLEMARREGTPFSDRSSILIPRRASSDALASASAPAPAPAPVPVPVLAPRAPPHSHSRARAPSQAQAEEASLHPDELNAAPHRALSKMEKALLRRVEFGPNIDLSKIPLA